MESTITEPETWRRELIGYAVRLLQDEQEAQDCVQNAYLAALREGPAPDDSHAWMIEGDQKGVETAGSSTP